MGDNDDTLAPPTEAARSDTGRTDGSEAETDSMDRVTPIRRVDSVTTSMIPIHRDLTPPPPPKAERRGVDLNLRLFVPERKQRTMRTMSDLNDMANPPRQSGTAQIKGRHNVVKPIEPPKADDTKK